MGRTRAVLWAGLDLALGSCCPGCAAAGPGVCSTCLSALLLAPPRRRPADDALAVPVHAAGLYGGLLRTVVVQYKEEGRRGLRDALARLLAGAVVDGLAERTWADEAIVLVPVPSSPRARRGRGFDPVAEVAQSCADLLCATGTPVRGARPLRHRRRVQDQSQLSASARRRNLLEALTCAPMEGNPTVVLVDDVCTSGATLREAARASERAGLVVGFAATVAIA